MGDSILNLIEVYTTLSLFFLVLLGICVCMPKVQTLEAHKSLNPFTPPSSGGSMDSEDRDILEPSLTLEEGLRRSQLRSMQSVNNNFSEVESIYKQIHGEALSQQGAIDTVEGNTLKTALLTGETVNELQKAKQKRDKRLKFRFLCVGFFLLILVVWLGLVLGLRRIEH